MKANAARVSVVVLAVGVVAFAGLVLVRVPWYSVGGGATPVAHDADVFGADRLSAMLDYSSQARLWSRLGLAASLLVACLLGFTPAGRWLMDRLRGPWWLRAIQGVAVLELAGSLATLPFSIALRQRQLDVGLSRQAWSGFATDRLTSLGVAIVTTSLGVVALMACVRRWRRAWPAVAGVGLGVLVLLGSFVYPLLVEPLFNTFTPLPDGGLRTQVLALAHAEGVAVDDVLVADASRRTTTLNAYVSGFGSTRRVVLYDNLVDQEPEDEVLSVVAHELGHAKYDDVLTGSLLGGAGALVAVGLLGVLVRRRDLGTAAVVPMLLALLAVGSLLALPVQNTISRQIETRADVTALNTTKDADAFEALQKQLAFSSLQDPSPASWSQLWFGSHPTVLRRLALTGGEVS